MKLLAVVSIIVFVIYLFILNDQFVYVECFEQKNNDNNEDNDDVNQQQQQQQAAISDIQTTDASNKPLPLSTEIQAAITTTTISNVIAVETPTETSALDENNVSEINTTNKSLPDDESSELNGDDSSKLKTLHIAGFFPMTGTGGWIGGSGCLPAAQMALDDVNARKDLLAGYKLELTYTDSQCNPGKAAHFLYGTIYYPPKKLIILCGCSTVCSIVAESAIMFNLIVVGYGASSPALSDRSRFSTFFRTHPSATIHNPTRIKLFEKFGWSRVAIILETEEVFIETARDLEQRCRVNNIQLVTRVSFVSQPTDAMDNLKRADPRIIVGMFYKQQARRVMCEAYKQGMYGEKYVWFLIGWYEDNWWTDVSDLDCTYEQMKLAVNGHLTTEGLVLNQDNKQTISGYTSKQWLRRYQRELYKRTHWKDATTHHSTLQQHSTQQQQQQSQIHDKHARPEGYQEAPLAYDAIWAIALALNNTIDELDKEFLSIDMFNYTTQNAHIKDVIQKNMRTTNFLGISGSVAFSDIGDRIAWTQIEQLVDGNYTVIGYYDYKTNNLTLNETRIRWPRGEPPRDRTIIKELVQYLSLTYIISIFSITLICIACAILLIVFNVSNRNDSLIRISHPPSNTLMLVGCIVCLISVILFGLDGRVVPANMFWLICDSRAFFLNIGFSLFFGSMFWKVWQSYVLPTRNLSLAETKNQVSAMVGLFCFIDVLIMLAWKIKEPMDRTTVKIRDQTNFELQNSGSNINTGNSADDDVIVELKIEYCQANFYWYYILFGYKGLLLVFGLFLAYETRGVKLKQLSDSKLVGMCIYNVAIMCFITGPVSLVDVMRQQVDYHYLFISLAIIFSCSLSMILIFAQKIVEYLKRRKLKNSSINGMRGSNNSNHNNSNNNNNHSNSNTDQKFNRENEEQYARIEKENKELDEKISEKESQVGVLLARILTARNSLTQQNSNKEQ